MYSRSGTYKKKKNDFVAGAANAQNLISRPSARPAAPVALSHCTHGGLQYFEEMPRRSKSPVHLTKGVASAVGYALDGSLLDPIPISDKTLNFWVAQILIPSLHRSRPPLRPPETPLPVCVGCRLCPQGPARNRRPRKDPERGWHCQPPGACCLSTVERLGN